MPGGDRTGPAGLGPMTGRSAGYCAGYPVPGYMNPVGGYGLGGWTRGRGGWGRRNWFYATGLTGWQRAAYGYPGPINPALYGTPFVPNITKEQELEALKSQAEYFENAINEITKRINELEAENKQ